MEELFEFEVYRKDVVITDDYISNFIEIVLDKNSLYWGGGYDLTKINGAISIDEEKSFDLNLIISEFVNYFSPQDKIIIKVYESQFDKIDSHTFVNYKNLDLTKTEDPKIDW